MCFDTPSCLSKIRQDLVSPDISCNSCQSLVACGEKSYKNAIKRAKAVLAQCLASVSISKIVPNLTKKYLLDLF